MMEMEHIRLCGKELVIIHKAKMHSDGMDFCYNYFEDTMWENAGFNCETCHVWSNKIGWSHFHRAVVAAYVLEEQYTENIAVALVNSDPVTSWGYVGWLNYLFDEAWHIRNFDAWNLFDAFYYSEKEYQRWYDWDNWSGFGNTRYAFISSCEIYAVIYGVDQAIEKHETIAIKNETEKLVLDGMKLSVNAIKKYVNEDEQSSSGERCHKMLNLIKLYYMQESHEDAADLYDQKYGMILHCLKVTDAPAFIVKVIAEIFRKDFWELWEEIKDVVYRKQSVLYGNEGYYVEPISTEAFFKQVPDDMIPYWEDNNEIIFSEELWKWFESLKREYDGMMQDENIVEHSLFYMLELMKEAEENYYNVFTFSDFFHECLENLNDKRYQVLWRIYDNMIHDPELKKAGDVIFVPDGPEYEKEGLHYWEEVPKRRLLRSWDFMEMDKKHNKGRMTLRRYMALVANRMLRKKVFGF